MGLYLGQGFSLILLMLMGTLTVFTAGTDILASNGGLTDGLGILRLIPPLLTATYRLVVVSRHDKNKLHRLGYSRVI